jgi:hypothetical protein
MRKQLLAWFLLFLAFLNAFGCSGSQSIRTNTTASTDASALIPVDIQLLGLPDLSADASAPTDASSDAPLFVPNNQNGELIVPLRQDASAPFNGVLFNGPAVARVSVEFQAQQQRCLIERRHDVDLIVARYNTDIATLNLARSTETRTANVLLAGRDQDITRLQRLLTAQTNENSGPHVTEGLIWAGGGLLVGVLLVGGIVLLVNSNP